MFRFFILLFVFHLPACQLYKKNYKCNIDQNNYTPVYESIHNEIRITNDNIPAMSFYQFSLHYLMNDYKWETGFKDILNTKMSIQTKGAYNFLLTDSNTLYMRYTSSDSCKVLHYLSKQKKDNILDIYFRDLSVSSADNQVDEVWNITYKDKLGCIKQAYYFQILKQNVKENKWVLLEAVFNADKFANYATKKGININSNADLRTSFTRHQYKIPFKRSIDEIIADSYKYSKIL